MNRGRMNTRDRRSAASEGGNGASRGTPDQGGRERTRGRADSGTNRNWFARHKVFSIVAVSLVVLIAAGGAVLANLASNNNSLQGNRLQTPPPTESPTLSTTSEATPGSIATATEVPAPTETSLIPPDYVFPKDVVNILVLGTDQGMHRSKSMGMRTDCIILVSINTKTNQVNMLSIPRDTCVTIYNDKDKSIGAYNKINSAFSYGYSKTHDLNVGVKYALNTVTHFINGGTKTYIPIDQYVLFDMDFVVELVRAVGGVTVDVDTELSKTKSDDPVNLKTGVQKLTAYEALAYARKRHGLAGGDVTRGLHQQQIMMATLQQIKKHGTITMIPQLYSAFQKDVNTSITAEMIPRLAWIAKDVNIKQMKMVSMGGQLANFGGNSLVIAIQDRDGKDPDSKQAKLFEMFGILVPVNGTESYSSLKSKLEKTFLAGQAIINRAQALLNNNKAYYTSSDAAGLRAAIAAWQAAKKANDEDGMADAQADVQVQYDILAGIIADNKAGAHEPTDTTEPDSTPPPSDDTTTEKPTEAPTVAPDPTVEQPAEVPTAE